MRFKGWLLALLIACCAAGCGPSGSAPSAGAPGQSADGWTLVQTEKIDEPKESNTYESFDIKRGEQARATVTAASAPVNLRLYVTVNGKETTLGEKKGVQDAVLEGKAPTDGTLQLQIGTGKVDKTTLQYKLEKR
jgi:hypothetical protein